MQNNQKEEHFVLIFMLELNFLKNSFQLEIVLSFFFCFSSCHAEIWIITLLLLIDDYRL
jgi:hypothetical protein